MSVVAAMLTAAMQNNNRSLFMADDVYAASSYLYRLDSLAIMGLQPKILDLNIY